MTGYYIYKTTPYLFSFFFLAAYPPFFSVMCLPRSPSLILLLYSSQACQRSRRRICLVAVVIRLEAHHFLAWIVLEIFHSPPLRLTQSVCLFVSLGCQTMFLILLYFQPPIILPLYSTLMLCFKQRDQYIFCHLIISKAGKAIPLIVCLRIVQFPNLFFIQPQRSVTQHFVHTEILKWQLRNIQGSTTPDPSPEIRAHIVATDGAATVTVFFLAQSLLEESLMLFHC